MAEVLISKVIELLSFLAIQGMEKRVKLVKGVEKDVGELQSNLRAIQLVLKDAEKKQLDDASVENWLDELKDVSFDMDDLLDEWNTVIIKSKIVADLKKKVQYSSLVSSFSCFKKVNRLSLRHDIALKIKDLHDKVDRIAIEKERYSFNTTPAANEQLRTQIATTSFVDESGVYGRDKEKEVLVNKLLRKSSNNSTISFDIIPIVAMGGLGKTTLAKLAYNDKNVVAHFEKRIWVCVSNSFDESKIAKAIIEALGGNAKDLFELDNLLRCVGNYIEGKLFLLVLDDVWTDDQEKWEQLKQPLKSGAMGSRILVTTRKKEVATMMGVASRMITLENLSEEDCQLIFKQQAFIERDEQEQKQLEGISQQIARKCSGLPLMAKTLGSLMRFKKTIYQWESVLHSELWEMKEDKKIFAPFLLSYYDLSPLEKCCFSFCSIFPKDYEIHKDQLIGLWKSQGYLGSGINAEEKGEDCFESLAMRSFFQEFRKNKDDGSVLSCKMHDMAHDFAKFLTKKECLILEVDSAEERIKPIDEKARHLALVIGEGAQVPTLKLNENNGKNLRTLFIGSSFKRYNFDGLSLLHLTRLRTLKLSGCTLKELPQNFGKLIHLRYLDLSWNFGLEELPDTTCDLCNLQNINLSHCSLKRLPRDFGRLIHIMYLNLQENHYLEELPETFSNLCHLQTLILSHCSLIKKLPENVGCLVSLRHLDLSFNPFLEKIPDDVSNLYNLQTLKMKYCDRIQALPEQMVKLLNLRLLCINGCDRLKGLPKGIETLPRLQIDIWVVPHNKEDYYFYSDLKDLQKLYTLQHKRFLYIHQCARLRNVGEAQKAGLKNKEDLIKLCLSFRTEESFCSCLSARNEDEEELLEALEPPPNLTCLQIKYYIGISMCPKWMVLLVNLKHLKLTAIRSESLPPLGKLPFLESIVMDNVHVEKLGLEFMGMEATEEDDDREGPSSKRGQFKSAFVSFPCLKKLIFQYMWKWKEWESVTAATDSGLVLMPRFHSLSFEACPNLGALPDFLQKTPLQSLKITECYGLKGCCEKGTGKQWPKISHVPNIIIDSHAIQGDDMCISDNEFDQET